MHGIKFVLISKFHVWVFHLHVFCAPHVYSILRGQKKMLGPLGLELQMAVKHHIVAGN